MRVPKYGRWDPVLRMHVCGMGVSKREIEPSVQDKYVWSKTWYMEPSIRLNM